MIQASCRKKYSYIMLILAVHHICFGILISAYVTGLYVNKKFLFY